MISEGLSRKQQGTWIRDRSSLAISSCSFLVFICPLISSTSFLLSRRLEKCKRVRCQRNAVYESTRGGPMPLGCRQQKKKKELSQQESFCQLGGNRSFCCLACLQVERLYYSDWMEPYLCNREGIHNNTPSIFVCSKMKQPWVCFTPLTMNHAVIPKSSILSPYFLGY